MATRGHLGGLARATSEVALVLDAAGKDVVLIETVGSARTRFDIVRTADVSVVVIVPGTGDEVQAIKARHHGNRRHLRRQQGRPRGAERTVASIEGMLSLQSWDEARWRPPVVRTEATTGRGVSDLWPRSTGSTAHGRDAGQPPAREAEFRVRELLGDRFLRHVEADVLQPGEMATLLDSHRGAGDRPLHGRGRHHGARAGATSS